MAYEYQYGKWVALTGKLQTMHDVGPAIVLDKAITVVPSTGDDDGISSPENDVGVIQLVLSEPDLMQQYRLLKGKKTRVECDELYHAITAHHKTPVLCAVSRFTQPNKL